MRSIKYRNEFLKNYKNNQVNEALANEVNWGDSLLGRLINSTIRKVGVSINLRKIDGVLKELENQLDELADIIKVPEESFPIVEMVRYKTIFADHIKELRESIQKGMDLDELIKLTEVKIKTVESYVIKDSEVESLRKEFLVLLNKFLVYLKGLSGDRKIGPYFLTNDGGIGYLDDTSFSKDNKSVTAYFYSRLKNEDEIVKEFKGKSTDLEKIYKKYIGYWKKSDTNFNTSNVVKNLEIDGQYINSNGLPDTLRDKKIPICHMDSNYDEPYHKKKKVQAFEIVQISILSNEENRKKLKEGDESVIKDVIKKLEEVNESKNSKLYKYLDFILEKKKDRTQEILEEFNSIFSEFEKKLMIENPEELENKVKESEENTIPLDPVLEIIRLFNRAYRLHTPGVIPSGRSDGKVSNSVFREYEYIGSGGSATADKPGAGPYRNIKIFDKWRDGVMALLKNSKYQTIFNEKTKFKIGEADTRKNVNVSVDSKTKTKTQGGGKTLLTFINSMLNDSTLYKGGAQSKFIAQYFNVELPDEKFNSTTFNDVDPNSDTSDGHYEEMKFIRNDKEKDISPNKIFRVKDNSGDYYYFRTIKKDDNFYLLFSKGYPFSNPKVEGVNTIPENNNLFFGKIDKRIIDSQFEIGDNFSISDKGDKGEEKVESNNFDWQNPEILFKGNKVYNTQPSLVDTHSQRWINFLDKYGKDYEKFFQ